MPAAMAAMAGRLTELGVVVFFCPHSLVMGVSLCGPVEAGSGLFQAGDAEEGELDFIG